MAKAIQTLDNAAWTVRAVGDVGCVPEAVRGRVIAGVGATVPGCVHTDLMDAGVIPDPAVGLNEPVVQWVSETDWCYELTFAADAPLLEHHEIDLCFECLDTIAAIELNGVEVGRAASEFMPWRFTVGGILKPGENHLRVTFTSPLRHVREMEARLGARPHNGDEPKGGGWAPYTMIRKCASNFGWDWGPRVATCGIDGPTLRAGPETVESKSTASKPRLVQFDPMSFQFTIDDVPTFMQGANWIPEGLWPRDRHVSRVRERLLQAKNAGMNMIRVWGGGRYESDEFYDICDELGLMVWQDFMFACGCYPEEEPLWSLVEAEARYQVARLSRHPCVVVWCGGNENHLAYESWGFKQRLKPGQTWGKRYWQEMLPRIVHELSPHTLYVPDSPWSPTYVERGTSPNDAGEGDRHTWDLFGDDFHKLVPRFCSEFGVQSPSCMETLREAGLSEPDHSEPDAQARVDPGTPFAPNDTTGVRTPTLARASGSEKLVPPALLARQRGPGGMKRWYDELFAKASLTPANTFDEWHAQAQQLQADWLYLAIVWLRANARTCFGALIWQLNDAWPGFSWSLIDSAGREKPAYHAVKRAFADRLVERVPFDGVAYEVAINDTDESWEPEPEWHIGPRSVGKRRV